ncbi:MAG: hypothetical protein H7A55_16295 [Verrucomicrobiaceae bacterium]|nr:hypothetical protein [Verrucomicrobiaceae bacterium]
MSPDTILSLFQQKSRRSLSLLAVGIALGASVGRGQDAVTPPASAAPEVVATDGGAVWVPTQQSTQTVGDAPVVVPSEGDLMDVPAAEQAEGPHLYYPTDADLMLMGDTEYPRYGSSSGQGPDGLLQNSMGIYPYDRNTDSFYERNHDYLEPVDQVLGFFTPHKATTIEFPGQATGAVTMDGQFPVFTRSFDPANAHLKAGPLFLDLVWLGAGVIWSDYSGPANFPSEAGDGFAGYVQLGARGMIRITESLYISTLADLIWLPAENKLAFSSGFGSAASLSLTAHLQQQWGSWDVLLFNDFYARPGLDVYAELDSGATDRAGRYQFGFYAGSRDTDFFEEQSVWFNNRIGLRASSLFLSPKWRMWLTAMHQDSWHTFDFENHQNSEQLGVRLAYEGMEFPITPFISYDVTSYDLFTSWYHRLAAGATSRITENITSSAEFGYLWTTNYTPDADTFVWNAQLRQSLTRSIMHGVAVGQDVRQDEFSPQSALTNWVRYWMTAQLSRRVSLSAYYQQSEGEALNRRLYGNNEAFEFNNWSSGATLSVRPWDFTHIFLRAAYQNGGSSVNPGEVDRWIFRAQLMQRLSSRVTFETFYQYDRSAGGAGDYDEHAVGASVRRYF